MPKQLLLFCVTAIFLIQAPAQTTSDQRPTAAIPDSDTKPILQPSLCGVRTLPVVAMVLTDRWHRALAPSEMPG